MTNAVLEHLIEDAELVAEVSARLGRLKDPGFLEVLRRAREALSAGAVAPAIVADLHRSLNTAVNDLSPITLNDLRSGWRPFAPSTRRRPGTFVFGVFSFLLLVATAYTTQIYDRATSLYSTTLELQNARGAEQAIRLLGVLRKNQKDVVESLTSGNKDFLYEAFNKALFDLQMINDRFTVYAPRAASVLHDLDTVCRLSDWVLAPLYGASESIGLRRARPATNPTIESWLTDYGRQQPPPVKPVPLRADISNLDIPTLLHIYIDDVRSFTSAINVAFDPLAPNSYSYYVYRLQEGMSFLGSWVLPLLYGMLGAVIFHMRRLLDPTVPDPSWLRFAYRIVLGGFAGIILVWFWTPSPQQPSQPAFATLTSFGLAFLVGFSTDVFFQVLDRLAKYVSQAVGPSAA
jgi:hypothetical protein